MAKIAYSTQIEYETLLLLNEYVKETGEPKSYVTNEAILKYIRVYMSKKSKEKE